MLSQAVLESHTHQAYWIFYRSPLSSAMPTPPKKEQMTNWLKAIKAGKVFDLRSTWKFTEAEGEELLKREGLTKGAGKGVQTEQDQPKRKGRNTKKEQEEAAEQPVGDEAETYKSDYCIYCIVGSQKMQKKFKKRFYHKKYGSNF